MWKADAEERKERREKGPYTEGKLFWKRFSRKIWKNSKFKKSKNQVQILVSWKIKFLVSWQIKFNFLTNWVAGLGLIPLAIHKYHIGPGLRAANLPKIKLGLDFVPPTLQKSRWAGISCRQHHKSRRAWTLCRRHPIESEICAASATKAGLGVIPLINSSYWGKLFWEVFQKSKKIKKSDNQKKNQKK